MGKQNWLFELKKKQNQNKTKDSKQKINKQTKNQKTIDECNTMMLSNTQYNTKKW